MDTDENKIYFGQSYFHFGPDNIIYNTIVGEIDGDVADKLRESQLEILNNSDSKLHSLINLNSAGMPTTAATRVGREVFQHEKLGKVALYGLSRMSKVVANFMIGITTKKNIRFFEMKQEALRWLKS